MKKLGILSIIVATLLLSGCNKKEEGSSTQKVEKVAVEQKATNKEECLPGMECSRSVEKMQKSTRRKENVEHSSLSAGKETLEKKVERAVSTTAKEMGNGGIDAKALFAKCAACHGVDGKQKALGKSGVIAGMKRDEVLKKLQGYQAGTLNQYGMGALMKGQLMGLGEKDLEALADYISALK